MIKIYGADLSSYSNKVRFTANYLGIEYEYKKVSLRDGEHKKPEYLSLHPAGKIPVLDDDGFILFESNAIMKYLADKFDSDLYPKERKLRAVVDQWVDFITIHVGGAIDRVAFNRVFAPRIKAPVDDRSIKVGVTFLNRFLPIVDNQLKGNQYLTGGKISLADLNLLASLDVCEISEINLSRYENIMRFLTGLREKDFYTKCHKNYAEKLKRVFG